MKTFLVFALMDIVLAFAYLLLLVRQTFQRVFARSK